MIELLKREILKASEELNSKELTYEIHFWYGTPSHSLKIADVELFSEYETRSGWNGIGQKELIELEKMGFLYRISEDIDDIDELEKTIKYRIIRNNQNILNS